MNNKNNFRNLFVLLVMDFIIICFFGGGIIGFFLINYHGIMNDIYGLIVINFGSVGAIIILLLDREKKKKIELKEKQHEFIKSK